jgi:hypothetical protein
MPINYGIQGPNLDQYGGGAQYASPVVGQEEGIPIGGSGAGFLPSQEELRRKALQEKNRGDNQLMAQELQKILGDMAVPSNYGLDAGMSFGQPQLMGRGAGRPQDFMSALNPQTSQFGGTMAGGGGIGFGGGTGGGAGSSFMSGVGFGGLDSQLDNMLMRMSLG